MDGGGFSRYLLLVLLVYEEIFIYFLVFCSLNFTMEDGRWKISGSFLESLKRQMWGFSSLFGKLGSLA